MTCCSQETIFHTVHTVFNTTIMVASPFKHQGSCRCNAVQVGLLTHPFLVYCCHCSHCRKFSSSPNGYHACAAWRWTVHVPASSWKFLEFERTTGAWGLFSMQRGRCAVCKDPVLEVCGRAATPFIMVSTHALHKKTVKPNTTNLYYGSGLKRGEENNNRKTTTIISDWASFLYEIWIVISVALPALPQSLYCYYYYYYFLSRTNNESD